MADFLNDLLSATGKEATAIIVYFNFIANNVFVIGILLSVFISIIIAYFINSNIHQLLKNVPIFNLFDKLAAIKKAIIFMPFYAALNRAGINDKQIVTLYKSIDKNIADNLLVYISRGNSLSASIKYANMPQELASNLSIVLKIDEVNAREKAFDGLIKLLSVQAVNTGKKISRIFSTVAFTLILAGIITLVFAYITMITISL